jgi:peptide-methionine (R)-S-oxide reductase
METTMQRRHFLYATAALVAAPFASGLAPRMARAEGFPFTLTEAEWRARLSDMSYRVLREEETERPNTSRLNTEKRTGTYHCAGCDQAAFASTTKYDSGTGWPSFWEPLPNAIGTRADPGLFGSRTEVHCSRCGGHFGHVFTDGPEPTGLRYCMNGAALTFKAA